MPEDDILFVLASHGARTVLRLQGELDISSAGVLSAAAAALPEPVIEVTIDLAALTFIDSTGAEALEEFHFLQVSRGRTVQYANARPFVRLVLEALGMGGWLRDVARSGGPDAGHSSSSGSPSLGSVSS